MFGKPLGCERRKARQCLLQRRLVSDYQARLRPVDLSHQTPKNFAGTDLYK